MEYVILGAAPGIAICLFIFYRDMYNKEPALNLIVSFLLGCLAIIPAIFFEDGFSNINDGSVGGLALYCYFIIAFSEEFSKFLGLRLYSYSQKAFDEPLDGIVYAVIVSMGFATVENIMYAIKSHDMNVVLVRMVLSVPAHGTFAVIMGYFAGKAKFDSKNSFVLLLTGLLCAMFFHGTFDFFLFYSQTPQGQANGGVMLAGGAIVSFIISLILCRKLIIRDRRISRQLFDKSYNPPKPPNA